MRFQTSTVVTRVLGILLLTMVATGCATEQSSLLAPSAAAAPAHAPANSLTLTISVLVRNSETPIEGALIRHHATGDYTNAQGELSIRVEPGLETAVEVSAPGYHTMTAAAVLNSDERWTFFLAAAR